ncbi:MAG: hypothetical protein ACLTS6_13535 [Anaerobutyricum sp.]
MANERILFMKNDSFYDTDNYKKKRQTSNKSSVSYRTSKTRNASYALFPLLPLERKPNV